MAENISVGVAIADANNSKERENYFREESMCDTNL